MASGEEKLPTLRGQTGRRHHLHQDHRPRSGSSSTAGVPLTTPCSPPLLLLTPSLPPSTTQRDTIPLSPPHASLQLKRPGQDPTVFLQRDRKCRRAALAAAAAKPRNFPTPRPIRINHKCRNTLSPTLRPIRIRFICRTGPLLLLHPVLCSPGGPSDRWLRPRKRGT